MTRSVDDVLTHADFSTIASKLSTEPTNLTATLACRVAALYVEPDGVYSALPDVDPWPVHRDARAYAGPYPVVAHPPSGVEYGHYRSGHAPSTQRADEGARCRLPRRTPRGGEGASRGMGCGESREAPSNLQGVPGSQPREDRCGEEGVRAEQSRSGERDQPALEDESAPDTGRVRRPAVGAIRPLRGLPVPGDGAKRERPTGDRSLPRHGRGSRAAVPSVQLDARPGEGQRRDAAARHCLPGDRQ